MNQIPFNLSLARTLAAFCDRAYRPLAGDRVLQIAQTDAAVLIVDTPDAVVLAFRGTRNLEDWITDARFFKAILSGLVKVHSGFLWAIDSIVPAIIAQLLPAGADKALVKPLIITGHSLGGALASLAAFFLQRAGFAVQSVYTFASPRVGNAAWRDDYNAICGGKSFRVACAGDLVPLIPGIFTPFMDGYRHVGEEVFLDGPRVLISPNHYLELALDGWKAYWAIRRRDIAFLVEFHSITGGYLASLNSIKEIRP